MSTTLFNDFQSLEKRLGLRMAQKFRRSIKLAIKNTQKDSYSGESKKSTATPKFKYGFLERIEFKTPYYVYPIQHVGFEGKKETSINRRLKPTDVMNQAIRQGKLVEELADEITELRGDQVMARLTLPKSKNVLNG